MAKILIEKYENGTGMVWLLTEAGEKILPGEVAGPLEWVIPLLKSWPGAELVIREES